MEAAGVHPGDRVLDVGCGCGGSSVELARRVGQAGTVRGVDVADVMLARATERAREAGLRNVTFTAADASTHPFDTGAVDVVYSRFGVMFFADPPAAFANIRRALVPGGRLAFVCWQAPEHNPWLTRPMAALAQALPMPPPPPQDAPGPFAFADQERVRTILQRAGFRDVACRAYRDTITLGATTDLDGAVEFTLQLGPAARMLREQGPEVRPTAARIIREALAPLHTAEGVRLPALASIVTARP